MKSALSQIYNCNDSHFIMNLQREQRLLVQCFLSCHSNDCAWERKLSLPFPWSTICMLRVVVGVANAANAQFIQINTAPQSLSLKHTNWECITRIRHRCHTKVRLQQLQCYNTCDSAQIKKTVFYAHNFTKATMVCFIRLIRWVNALPNVFNEL